MWANDIPTHYTRCQWQWCSLQIWHNWIHIEYGYKRKLKRLPERQKFQICYYRNQFHTKDQQSTLYTMKDNIRCIVLPEQRSQVYNPVFWPYLTQMWSDISCPTYTTAVSVSNCQEQCTHTCQYPKEPTKQHILSVFLADFESHIFGHWQGR